MDNLILNDIETTYKSVDEILAKAKSANNHFVRDFIKPNSNINLSGKGFIGQIIEEGLFGYKNNSKKEADFANLGIELKVTGLKANKNKKLSMKERLVLNIINYFEEAEVDFENSSFWKKNQYLLIMFYLYEYTKSPEDFLMLNSILHEFDSKDLEIIKNDFKIIQNKIKNGEAHNISEADTMYLAACTKGATRDSSLRSQPFSNELAQQRAYCLKASYMNSIVRKVFANVDVEELVTYEELKDLSFEAIIENKLSMFYGCSEEELCRKFDISTENKAKFSILLSRMLGINGSVNQSEEFEKAGIVVKTIRIEENGKIKEHMSFPHFEYTKIINQTFEESEIFEEFTTKKFLFAVFRNKKGKYYFEKIKFWNMPYNEIYQYVKPVYEITKQCVENGNIVNEIKDKKYITNFPKPSFNNVCHVRPHDTASIQVTGKGLTLPIRDKITNLDRYTKHCFWLDNRYILKIINLMEK